LYIKNLKDFSPKYVCPSFKSTRKVEFKNCFGAVAGYVGGNIFISCGKFGVVLKLSKKVLDGLFKEKDVRHLKYFPKGHVKKEYAVIPERILNNKRQFQKLVDESIKYVTSKR